MELKNKRPSFYGSANIRTTVQFIKKICWPLKSVLISYAILSSIDYSANYPLERIISK